MRLPIGDRQQPWSSLTPFRRYGGVKVGNRQFVPTPVSFNALARDDPFEFWDDPRVFGLSVGEEIVTLDVFVSIQYRSMRLALLARTVRGRFCVEATATSRQSRLSGALCRRAALSTAATTADCRYECRLRCPTVILRIHTLQ